LTATFHQVHFAKTAERNGFSLYDKPRGNPANVGSELKAVHPVVRTNPVTGWKSVFPIGAHVGHINNVTKQESDNLLKWFYDLVKDHSIQVRHKWQNENDIGAFPCA
jgi:alpha-ketoglutarate-dependent taurine dioxygenase